MRVLHVLDHSIPLQSGYTFRTLNILKHQRQLGWKTSHLTSTKQYTAKCALETVDGYEFYRTLPSGSAFERLPLLAHAAVIHSLADRLAEVSSIERPDVIHAHSPALNGVAALRVARRMGIPLVYEMRASWEDAAVDHATTTEKSLRYRASRSLESWVLRRADQVTTISDGLYEDILARGVPAERVSVIPNAVDLAAFSEGLLRDTALAASLGIAGATVIGFAGSFYRYEGLEILLRALPAIRAQAPKVKCLLVGGGPQAQVLESKATELGVDDVVVFTGRVPHEDVPRYYSLMDVLVYPRLSNRLTELVTPLKPLEAMAQRKIVVASDVGGHRELIEHAKTGWLFRAGDPSALAASTIQVLEDADRSREIVDTARRFVERERTWSHVVGKYRHVYAHATGIRTL